MRNMAVLVAVAVFLLTSCGPRIQQTRSRESLSTYNTVAVRVIGSNQGTSSSGGYLGGINSSVSSANVLNAGDAAQQAALSFAFELEFVGFRVTNDPEQADAIVEFGIGTVRYDAIAGWIADQAIARFIDTRSGESIAAYRASTSLITPTTRTLVNDLMAAIRRDF